MVFAIIRLKKILFDNFVFNLQLSEAKKLRTAKTIQNTTHTTSSEPWRGSAKQHETLTVGNGPISSWNGSILPVNDLFHANLSSINDKLTQENCEQFENKTTFVNKTVSTNGCRNEPSEKVYNGYEQISKLGNNEHQTHFYELYSPDSYPLVIDEHRINICDTSASKQQCNQKGEVNIISSTNNETNLSKDIEGNFLTTNDPLLTKISTTKRRRVRGPKSWEYLLRLLRDPSTNPSLIRWENESEGIFRLVKPDAIALRWGKRTGKHFTEMLSYENFARGLRYHYATGALTAVSERCFVYKFGPKAQNAIRKCDDVTDQVGS